jgi:hypothetical protein
MDGDITNDTQEQVETSSGGKINFLIYMLILILLVLAILVGIIIKGNPI